MGDTDRTVHSARRLSYQLPGPHVHATQSSATAILQWDTSSWEALQTSLSASSAAAADTLISTLTVEEMLMYTARLKRPITESRESKQAAVDQLLAQLGLTGCKDVRIGDPLQKGISGGQVSGSIHCVPGGSSKLDLMAINRSIGHQSPLFRWSGLTLLWAQAKRVNIGIALITNPKVIFLDEPTSGLDSYT